MNKKGGHDSKGHWAMHNQPVTELMNFSFLCFVCKKEKTWRRLFLVANPTPFSWLNFFFYHTP